MKYINYQMIIIMDLNYILIIYQHQHYYTKYYFND